MMFTITETARDLGVSRCVTPVICYLQASQARVSILLERLTDRRYLKLGSVSRFLSTDFAQSLWDPRSAGAGQRNLLAEWDVSRANLYCTGLTL
jgi:hypothetical protein